MMWIERLFAHLDGDVAGSEPGKIRALQIILGLVVCTEYWTKALNMWAALGTDDAVALGIASLVCITIVHGRWRRPALAALAGLQAWYVWSLFPQAGNHRYLELTFAVLLASFDDENPEEQRFLLRSLRWTVVVVLFYSGLQKLVHGYYFQGQYLAFSMWRDTFRASLGWLLPAEELQRLMSYSWEVGDGPYSVSSPLFVAVSNAVWLSEMALAILLLPRATRTVACVATCCLIVVVEAVAREFLFGIEFFAAILLFAGSDVIRHIVKPVAVLLALLVLVRLGALPEIVFR